MPGPRVGPLLFLSRSWPGTSGSQRAGPAYGKVNLMPLRQLIGLVGVLSVAIALTMALPGCGDPAKETNPDGTIKLAPGTIDPEQEAGPPPRTAK